MHILAPNHPQLHPLSYRLVGSGLEVRAVSRMAASHRGRVEICRSNGSALSRLAKVRTTILPEECGSIACSLRQSQPGPPAPALPLSQALARRGTRIPWV